MLGLSKPLEILEPFWVLEPDPFWTFLNQLKAILAWSQFGLFGLLEPYSGLFGQFKPVETILDLLEPMWAFWGMHFGAFEKRGFQGQAWKKGGEVGKIHPNHLFKAPQNWRPESFTLRINTKPFFESSLPALERHWQGKAPKWIKPLVIHG